MRCCTTAADRRRPSRPTAARAAVRHAAVALSLLLALGAAASLAGGDSPLAGGRGTAAPARDLEAEGKRIYRTGRASAGPAITARLGGEGGAEVDAVALPCAGCHGRDGRGRPEGGITPSDLTRDVLTRPYGATHPDGRRTPPYDDRSLKRAITLGIDAGGNPLQAAMPRYRLTQDQAGALIAFLRQLGREADPGVFADRLRVGVLLPPGAAAEEIRRHLDGFAARLGSTGGIYGRILELRYLSPDDPRAPLLAALPNPWPAAVERFLASQQIFALVASSFEGASERLGDLAVEMEVPVVGALTASPRVGAPFNRYVFYLRSGLAEQARAMVESLAGELGGEPPRPRRMGLLLPDGAAGGLEDAAAAARDQCDRIGLRPWMASYGTSGAELRERIAAASRAGVDALIFVGGAAAARDLLARAAEVGWRPRVYLLAEVAAGAAADAPEGFAGRLYLAAPALASDLTARGRELLRPADAAPPSRPSGGSPPVTPAMTTPPLPAPNSRAAVAALEVLSEAMTRAGRELSRERLIAALESLRFFQTGLTPPLTFAADRRVGALGAYIVTFDPKRRRLDPVGGWVTPR